MSAAAAASVSPSRKTSVNNDRPASKHERQIADFDLRGHLRRTRRAPGALRHIRVGLENYLATKMMRGALVLRERVPREYRPRAGHYRQIEAEVHSLASKRRQLIVFAKMPLLGGMNPSGVDFVQALQDYEFLDYHNYYLQPFHSLPGGWLSPLAAAGNEAAMRALFQPAHRRGAEGLREVVAQVMPRDASLVYDFGGACGMQSALFAERMGPDGKVVCIDPSPFGLILGKRQQTDARIEWIHNFVEDAQLPDASADFVNLLFVLHETPDHIKQTLLAEAYRVLKPGGTVLISEPPLWDLEYRSRGFFEPYRDQWLKWQPLEALKRAGFGEVRQVDLVSDNYMISFTGTRAAA